MSFLFLLFHAFLVYSLTMSSFSLVSEWKESIWHIPLRRRNFYIFRISRHDFLPSLDKHFSFAHLSLSLNFFLEIFACTFRPHTLPSWYLRLSIWLDPCEFVSDRLSLHLEVETDTSDTLLCYTCLTIQTNMWDIFDVLALYFSRRIVFFPKIHTHFVSSCVE